MKAVSPHRKRRANKGRIDTGVVLTHGYKMVAGHHVWHTEVVKDARADYRKEIDAIIDERGMQRNRFNADHRVCLTAPDLCQVRKVIKRIEYVLPHTKLDIVKTGQGMLSIKVEGDAAGVLRIIQNSQSSRIIQVVEAFCGENKSPMASTVRSLHGRRY